MKIVVVGSSNGDWEGMYVDGKLKVQGHSIHWTDALEALGLKFEQHEADDEWMGNFSNFPSSLKKVVLKKDEK
jgi:hypothetical protein